MYYGARGIVGLVKPTYRPGSMESFIKLMPEGVGFIPAHAGIRAGNEKELQEALTVAERKVARLAELGADVVMIMGAPPTMVRGHGADREIADSLTTKYKIPVTVATIVGGAPHDHHHVGAQLGEPGNFSLRHCQRFLQFFFIARAKSGRVRRETHTLRHQLDEEPRPIPGRSSASPIQQTTAPGSWFRLTAFPILLIAPISQSQPPYQDRFFL